MQRVLNSDGGDCDRLVAARPLERLRAKRTQIKRIDSNNKIADSDNQRGGGASALIRFDHLKRRANDCAAHLFASPLPGT